MMAYTVFLINFGYSIYEGNNLFEATEKAEKAGFEASLTMTKENGESAMHFYSPISGWR